MTLPRILLLVLLTVASRAMSMSSHPDFIISFHLQGSSDTDSHKSIFQVNVKGQNLTFMKAPEFTQENIAAFYPFPDKKSGTNGIFIRLDGRGRRKLEIASQSTEGRYLIALVNAKPVDMVVLDRLITDGAITIWQGVPDTVVAAMKKKYRVLKPGEKLPSASDSMDMDPETRSEKKKLLSDDPSTADSSQPQQQQQKGGGLFGLFKSKSQPKKDDTQVLTLPEYNQDSTTPSQSGSASSTTSRIPTEGGNSAAGMASPSLGGGTTPPPSDSAPPSSPPVTDPRAYVKPLPPQPRAPGD